ncbi:hypothetical protein MKZ07_33470 [Paenibacillus sp. FSL P4-0338]|uniref:hypothetical protein n=1 Tax=Paenibacillus sp. FSL P4-0338 TaxID=2921635 RepID=UPI001F27DFF3|nr:hypothetical protein [Paenibacillus sp. FSL R7-269]
MEDLKEMLECKIKTVLDAIYALPVEEAKVLLRTLVSKVTVLGEGELDIELNLE